MAERKLTIAQFLVTPPIEMKDLFEHPTCTDFERRFRSVLAGEGFDDSGEKRSLGTVVARTIRTRVTNIYPWGVEAEGEHFGIIKNPDGDQKISRFVGSRNALVVVGGTLFAGDASKEGVVRVVRPVRAPYQTEFRPAVHNIISHVDLFKKTA